MAAERACVHAAAGVEPLGAAAGAGDLLQPWPRDAGVGGAADAGEPDGAGG